jgi:hypothetical protein
MVSIENIRARATDIREKVRSRVEELRTGASSSSHSPILGKLEIGKNIPLAAEIKEKGVVTAARERIAKVRGGGLLGGLATAPPSPAAPPTPKPTMYPATAEVPQRVDLMTKARLY